MSALFLATTNKILIDAIFKPLRDRFPGHDFFWLFYVSLLTGGAIGWFSEGNMFAEFIPDPIFGRVLTSILIGGGASLIHELFGNLNTAIRSVSINNWSQAEAADVVANTPPAATAVTPADVAVIARTETIKVMEEATRPMMDRSVQ
jgi:hypothetical protein